MAHLSWLPSFLVSLPLTQLGFPEVTAQIYSTFEFWLWGELQETSNYENDLGHSLSFPMTQCLHYELGK